MLEIHEQGFYPFRRADGTDCRNNAERLQLIGQMDERTVRLALLFAVENPMSGSIQKALDRRLRTLEAQRGVQA